MFIHRCVDFCLMCAEVMRGARKMRIARRMTSQSPTIRIGKAGITRGLVDEVSKQLDKRRVVKLKVLRSFLTERSVRDVAVDLARKTGSTLVEVRGHTFVLYRRRRPAKRLR
ncbi:MAG TPA: YhbY family RNA-binding protein [Candidatus Bathyarchaeota archaeon]|nr:YhbY family RNA-binding protein [Candidatus Bathyarchaeota archaeon]